MMAFFNSNAKRKSKLLMVTILVMTLIVTYAMPMTVLADDLQPTEQSQEQQQNPGEGTGGPGSGNDDPVAGTDLGEGTDDPVTGADDPGVGSADPVAGTDLGEGTDDPATGADDPGAGSEDPGAGSADPVAGTDDFGEGFGDPDTISVGGIGDGGSFLGEQMMMAPMMILTSTHGTSGDGIVPEAKPQNQLPDLSGLSSFRVANQRDGLHPNNDGFAVTLRHYEDINNSPTKADWNSNWDVKYVVVKGQGLNHLNIYDYGTGDNGDTGLMAPLDNQDGISTINYIEFYYAVPQLQYNISLDKKVSHEKASPGDKVTFTFTVRNTGDDKLSNVVLKDSLFGQDWQYSFGEINKNGNKVFSIEYTIPNDASGTIENLATVTGDNGKTGDEKIEVSASDRALLTICPAYDMTLEKTVSPEIASPGDLVTYKFKVTNTGLKKLYNIKIDDDMINDNFLYKISLDPGKSIEFKRIYYIPQNTPVNSTLTNTATVTGMDKFYKGDVKATAIDTADLTVIAKYAISLVKTVDTDTALPGDEVTYTFTIKNIGSKGLTNVVLLDSKLGPDWNKEIAKLKAGEEVSFNENHIIPLDAPINADYINTATVEGEYKVWQNGYFKGPKWIPGKWVTKKVFDEDTAIVYVVQEQQEQETVKFFVRSSDYPRPTVEGSQPVAHFTGELGTLTIDFQTPKPAIGYSLVNEFALDADENIVENKAIELSSLAVYNTLMEAIKTKMETDYSSFLPIGDGVTWRIDWYDFKWEGDCWHIDGDIVIIPDDEPEDTEFNYTVYYKVIETNELLHTLTGSAIMVDFPLNVLEPDVVKNNSSYSFYSNTHGDTADVTFNLIIDVTNYVATVWYEPVSEGEEPGPGPGPGPSRGGGGGSTTIVEEPIPAGPITTPEAIDSEQIILDEEEIPGGTLPKTGGIPSMLLYGLGALLISGGTAMKLKNKKR